MFKNINKYLSSVCDMHNYVGGKTTTTYKRIINKIWNSGFLLEERKVMNLAHRLFHVLIRVVSKDIFVYYEEASGSADRRWRCHDAS